MPASVVPPVVEKEVPSWKSPNELIHERINFDDTIWGFGLAGGAYYKTPLRITYVKPGSRAQMAHIYPGDVVLRINGIESSTLTLEEAHQIILESGIHLKINVTSPEDLEDNYYCYVDPLQAQMEELKAKQNIQRAIPKVQKVLGKSSHWSLQWPWKTKRKTIYKESNCYLVPSKYEEKHKDTRKPEVKPDDMIVLDSIHSKKGKKGAALKNQNKDNVKEQSQAAGKTEKDAATALSSEDKNNEVGAMDQSVPVDLKKEDDNVENETTDNKSHEEVTAEENTVVDKNNEDIAKENSSVEKGEDVTVGQISSADKNNEDIATEEEKSTVKTSEDVAEQNNSVGDVDAKNLSEPNDSANNNNEKQNISGEGHNENSVQENIITVNEDIVKDVAEQDNAADKNDEQNSAEINESTDKNQTEGDNVKLENGDIPVITESENLNHNSR